MKQRTLLLVMLLIGCFTLGTGITNEASAQRQIQVGKQLKDHSRKMIKRTFIVLNKARFAVKKDQNYTGDLARAKAHQRFAIKMHHEGKLPMALYHTHRARVLSKKAIEANNGAVPPEADFTQEELNNLGNLPPDEELDARLPVQEFNDQQALKEEWGALDLD